MFFFFTGLFVCFKRMLTLTVVLLLMTPLLVLLFVWLVVVVFVVIYLFVSLFSKPVNVDIDGGPPADDPSLPVGF